MGSEFTALGDYESQIKKIMIGSEYPGDSGFPFHIIAGNLLSDEEFLDEDLSFDLEHELRRVGDLILRLAAINGGSFTLMEAMTAIRADRMLILTPNTCDYPGLVTAHYASDDGSYSNRSLAKPLWVRLVGDYPILNRSHRTQVLVWDTADPKSEITFPDGNKVPVSLIPAV